MYYSAGTYNPALPVAAFDFDSTLRPYRGSGPPEDLTLRFLAGLSAAFNLVIITSRSGDTPAALAPVKAYVATLDAAAQGSVTVYASTALDRDRKPHTGAWEHFLDEVCRGARPWFAFYCGDAAGREGDHAATDYMFALNIGVPFVTPEALFTGGSDPWADPATFGCDASAPPGVEGPAAGGDDPLLQLGELPAKCAVIMVGSPASGKSRIAGRLVREKGYVLASGDAQGTRHRSVFDGALAAGRAVVVDNTSPLASDRAYYAGRAAARGYTVVVCHVSTPKALCFHLNAARCQLDAAGRTREIPAVVLHSYWKRAVVPTEKEVSTFGGRLVVVPFALAPDAPPEVTRYRYPWR